ncbi:hypothetical protein OGATHE_002478 [Ogataea polymorpha]|uniref:Uncharacterized protein n=1 Tax=Ogataea polymorpha TaxID=460523 RepID=A0A9P8T946_9ASCO|nr:hypothetical protein OGATHE_002478 [Ogataea polymorpha]
MGKSTTASILSLKLLVFSNRFKWIVSMSGTDQISIFLVACLCSLQFGQYHKSFSPKTSGVENISMQLSKDMFLRLLSAISRLFSSTSAFSNISGFDHVSLPPSPSSSMPVKKVSKNSGSHSQTSAIFSKIRGLTTLSGSGSESCCSSFSSSSTCIPLVSSVNGAKLCSPGSLSIIFVSSAPSPGTPGSESSLVTVSVDLAPYR